MERIMWSESIAIFDPYNNIIRTEEQTMFKKLKKKLKKKFTKYITRGEIGQRIWFTCDHAEVKDSNVRQGRKVICFPDGLKIITEHGKYVGFATKEPYK